ncbi:MAG: hypothetical protein JNM19_16900 [Chitinophagaceae bacterium]|nr:hypothetical protein [Chitinophagaceae bacterium]
MQRRNFISNLAVILPAGMIAPKLLLENTPPYKKLLKTNVLVLGANKAGIFIANQLRKEKIETIVLEPSGGINQSSIYNHMEKSGVIRQRDKHTKASVQAIAGIEYSEVEDVVMLDFIPSSIKKTDAGYMVSDGTTAYSAEKLVISLPVEIDLNAKALKITVSENSNKVLVSYKRRNPKQKNSTDFTTISASMIDEEKVLGFAIKQSQGILAVL